MSVTFVTHRRFAVVFFVPSCCVSSLLISHRDAQLLNHNTVKPVYSEYWSNNPRLSLWPEARRIKLLPRFARLVIKTVVLVG